MKLDFYFHFRCSKNQFRCGYGACIDLKLKCDGVKHCPDGSDEFSELCKVISETPAPKPTPTPVTERLALYFLKI